MQTSNCKEEKEREFFEKFGADKIWVHPSKENVEIIHEMWAFMLKVQKESIEQAIEVLESKRRKYLHTVVAIGSQEHLNDTFREGYNQCIEDSSEALKTLLH